MSEPLGVGLHIIYGRMGAGKSNFAVSEVIRSSTYQNVICNIPLVPEFIETSEKKFEIYKKLEPEKVIRCIDENHQDTLFIVDEAQMCLISANKLLVDSFIKKMSQIRQNNQCCVVIAQISKMLPTGIRDLAEDCYFFENNNVRGIEKTSKVKHYRTGYDYTSRLIETFTYVHVYGLYESTNTPTTEKPKNLFKRTYIKIGLIFLAAFLLFCFVGYKFYSFFNHYSDDSESLTKDLQENDKISSSLQENDIENKSSFNSDSLCIRSWNYEKNSIVRVMFSDGNMKFLPLVEFYKTNRCPLI